MIVLILSQVGYYAMKLIDINTGSCSVIVNTWFSLRSEGR